MRGVYAVARNFEASLSVGASMLVTEMLVHPFRSRIARHRATLATTRRAPLPPAAAKLVEPDEAQLAAVDAFVDQLTELSLERWLALGRQLIADEQGGALRAAAWSAIETAMADQRLGLSAWLARDAVETAACLVCRPATRLSRSERRLFSVVHGAANRAVLAHLARPHLAPTDFEVLVSPFSSTRAAASESSSQTLSGCRPE